MKVETVLCVDIGNSCIKWGVCELEQISWGQSGLIDLAKNEIEQALGQQLAGLNVMPVWVAAVAEQETKERVLSWFEQNWSVAVNFIESENQAEKYRHLNVYSDGGALGVDRWIAMLAAMNRVGRPYCVIDAGTAITVDVVDKEANHVGGMIMPGKRLMFKALSQGTQNIDQHEQQRECVLDVLGTSTKDAVMIGVANSIMGGLSKALGDIKRNYHGIEFIVTGGDAEWVQQCLEISLKLEKNLVLDGIGLIARDVYA